MTVQDLRSALPPRPALLLDFDGTLVEIAPRPDAVRVPPDLLPVLAGLAARLDGALAVVSGRPLRDLDHYLPLPIAKAGDHGAAVRLAPDAPVIAPELPHPPIAWRGQAVAFVERHAGTLLEDKEHGFVVHYRLAPEAGEAARDLLAALVAERPTAFTLLEARMAWEVRPRGVSKSTAVATLMAHPPFAGRAPVFVGDDVTDEEGMEAARALGGAGFLLQDAFGTPAGFRAWLAELNASLAAAAPAAAAGPTPATAATAQARAASARP